MKAKYLILALIGAILLYGTAVYAEDAFSPEKAFGSYYSYERLDPADNIDKDCYIVSNSNEINSKALFLKDMQMTGFKYNSIVKNGYTTIVSKKTENGIKYGMISNSAGNNILLSVEYASIEPCGEQFYYIVSRENKDNGKALFRVEKPLTDYIYDSIDVNSTTVVVGQKMEKEMLYGLLDKDTLAQVLPVEYSRIDKYDENNDIKDEYVIAKGNGINDNAIYKDNEFKTGFIYDTIDKYGRVSYKTESGKVYYGLIRCSDGVQLLPIEYTSIEFDGTLYHRFCKAVKADGSEYYYIFDENEVMTNAASDEGFESLVERYEDEDNARYTKEESESWASVIKAAMITVILICIAVLLIPSVAGATEIVYGERHTVWICRALTVPSTFRHNTTRERIRPKRSK